MTLTDEQRTFIRGLDDRVKTLELRHKEERLYISKLSLALDQTDLENRRLRALMLTLRGDWHRWQDLIGEALADTLDLHEQPTDTRDEPATPVLAGT